MIKNIDKFYSDLEEQNLLIDLKALKNKNIVITGANGMICSYIVEFLMYENKIHNSNITVFALGRNLKKLEERFSNYLENKNLKFIVQDVCQPLKLFNIDYIIHGASNAHPNAYVKDPVGTMNANYIGMLNVLECAKENNSKVLYISSSEVYGSKCCQSNEWKEEDSGYVNTLNSRSSYPISKRAAETLCISYMEQHGIDVKIVRPCHIYGPTMTNSDSRAVSSFIRDVINGNDIIMKSEGKPIRSYCYVGDAVRGIMTVLLNGKSGEAYNISDENSIVSIKELAYTIATIGNQDIIIDIPKDTNTGFTPVEKTIISSEKLKNLGWKPIVNLNAGISKTLEITSEQILEEKWKKLK